MKPMSWTIALVALAACRAEAGGTPVEEARGAAFGAPAAVEPSPVTDAADDAASDAPFDRELVRLALRHAPLGEPPPDPTNAWADDPDAARLGQALFFDERLSANGAVSCATCHQPQRAFTDGRSLSSGLAVGRRHTPTLLNAAYNRWHFWDGRADSLWAQALQPLEAPAEQGSTRVAILRTIADDSALRRAWESVFGPLPEPLEPGAESAAIDRAFANVGKAIAAYERRLVSRDSRFDRFVAALRAGRSEAFDALSEAELRGLETFLGKGGCRLCHAGPEFTDLEFHDTRVPPLEGRRATDAGRYGGIATVRTDPFNGAGAFSDAPAGRARDKVERLVHDGASWGEFKTPTLRNVARTAPYMHEGQFATLHDVVRYYSTLEGALPSHDHGETTMVPLELTEREIDDLVAFLHTLNGEPLPAELLGPPAGLEQ